MTFNRVAGYIRWVGQSGKLTRRFVSRALLAGAGLAGCGGFSSRPNILWIASEDSGPNLGCYGDPNAGTFQLDQLARDGILFERAFATYPVAGAARTTLLTGIPANVLGAGNTPSTVALPRPVRLLPALLREAGYYCTCRGGASCNVPIPDEAWDGTGEDATYANRGRRQPFFHLHALDATGDQAVRERRRPRHDPERVVLPPYHPDTAVVRNDWARYYDAIASMDAETGQVLDELEANGAAGDTIVFYFSIVGGALPRTRGFLYDSGVHVPLIIRFPERFHHLAPAEPGTRTDRLVAFEDFAPTVLSLAGATVPDTMRGTAIAGEADGARRDYVHLARDRADACPNLVRAVRDARYQYVRNYPPLVPAAQYDARRNAIPSWAEMRSLYEEGELTRSQRRIFEPAPDEELYDTETDPHEMNNLAGQAEFDDMLVSLREVHRRHRMEVRDTGFCPETELERLAGGTTPYEASRDDGRYPLGDILRVVELAAAADTTNLPMMAHHLADQNTVVQYWGAVGCRVLEGDAEGAGAALEGAARESPSEVVRIVTAEALCYIGETEKNLTRIAEFLRDDRPGVRLTAAVHLGRLGWVAAPLREALEAFVAGETDACAKLAGENALHLIGTAAG